MATGYTNAITKGCTFESYAKRTMRAMGACIELRDGRLGDTFTPEDCRRQIDNDQGYHEREYLKAVEKSKRPDSVLLAGFVAHVESETASIKKAMKTNKDDLIKYREMLSECKSFVAPTSGHKEWRDFMISQIEESIKHDDHTASLEHSLDQVRRLDSGTHIKIIRQGIADDIAYHKEGMDKREEIDDSAYGWVKDAFDAIEKHVSVES